MAFQVSTKHTFQLIIIVLILLIPFYNKLLTNYNILQTPFSFNINIYYNNDNQNININETNIDLSIVVATRNDNHSSNPILRLKLFLNQFIMYEWKNNHNISVEVNVVEWNYIENNPHVNENKELKELLEYNKIHKNVDIKFYKIHPKYNDTKNCQKIYNIPCIFPQYFPKNIGIRRSNGKWILITNMDDVFSIKLMNLLGHYISNNLFDINGIYQANWDERNYTEITANYDGLSLIKTVYDTSKDNIPLDQCMRPLNPGAGVQGIAIYSLYPSEQYMLYILYIGWGGDFILLNRDHIFNNYVGGYLETCSSSDLDSEFIARQIHINGLQPYCIRHACSYIHIQHERTKTQRTRNPCFKAHTGNLWRVIVTNKTLRNDTSYAYAIHSNVSFHDMYKLSDQTWGLKNINLTYDIY